VRGTKDFKIEPGVKAPSDVVIGAGVNPNFFTRILPGMFDPLTRGKIAELFGIVSNLTPDDILDGKVVVIDIPIAKYREVGQLEIDAVVRKTVLYRNAWPKNQSSKSLAKQ
jgi:hypothetical protein